MSTLAQFAEQIAVVLEKNSEDFRHAEYILPMENRIEDIRLQMRAELGNLLCMTRRTEPAAATAAEGQQVFVRSDSSFAPCGCTCGQSTMRPVDKVAHAGYSFVRR